MTLALFDQPRLWRGAEKSQGSLADEGNGPSPGGIAVFWPEGSPARGTPCGAGFVDMWFKIRGLSYKLLFSRIISWSRQRVRLHNFRAAYAAQFYLRSIDIQAPGAYCEGACRIARSEGWQAKRAAVIPLSLAARATIAWRVGTVAARPSGPAHGLSMFVHRRCFGVDRGGTGNR